ncbi:MAG: protein kinase [Candidatus Thorarchaeota archaeon]
MTSRDDDKTRTHAALAHGTLVLHYRILEKIGAGGMGEVYLAEDTKLNRRIALKFMPSHLASDKELRIRFTREAQAAAKLDHPNIVPVHEVGEYEGRPYIAMAHIEGESLRDVIKKGKLSISESVALTMQICDGLQKAHEAGIVHRDIKPGNIIVDGASRARILDFGLATVTGDDKLTKTGSTLGTVGYMSPEQIGGKTVDKRSDIFSVGVILYEMITGRRPFAGDNDAAVLKAITESAPEPLARFKSGVTGELQRIVSKSLAKDPSVRYQSSDGLLADLRQLTLETTQKKSSRIGLWVAGGVILLAAAYFGLKTSEESAIEKSSGRMMLAVLPFENLGSPEDEYFADGITEEITSKVAVLDELGVIARTSVLQYKGTKKRIRKIGEELGVEFILEGTIRWDKSGSIDRVRITPQLIRVSDETHLWTDNFQKDLSEIFEVQAEIAENIAEALNITLAADHQEEHNSQPTNNLDAYDFYLRGKNYLAQGVDANNFLTAIRLFDEAIRLDSNFAEALAWKAHSHASYAFWYDLGGSVQSKPARLAYQRAFEIEPNLPEAYLARGTYSNLIERDYDKALEDFKLAQMGHIDEALILSEITIVKMRQGKWDEALEMSRQVTKLDPRSIQAATLVVWPLWYTHRYSEANEILDRMISLAPDEAAPYWFKVMVQINMGVDANQIDETIAEWVRHLNEDDVLVGVGGVSYLGFFRFGQDFPGLKAELARVKSRLNRDSDPIQFFYTGLLHRLGGEVDSAYLYIDLTRLLIEASIEQARNDTTGMFELIAVEHNIYELLALSYSLTDRHEEAIEQAHLAMEAMPIESCYW